MPSAGQFVVSMDPGPDNLDQFRSWYGSVRLPAVLTVPGVSGATRWEAVSRYARAPEGGMKKVPAFPADIVVYDLDDVDVALSEAFLDAHGRSFANEDAPVPYQTLMSLPMGEVTRQENAAAAGATPGAMMVVSLTPQRDFIDVMHEWYDTVHVGELLGCPGFQRTRRYRALAGIPNFFAFYDLDKPETLDGELFKSLSGRTFDKLPAIQQKVGPNMTSNICDVYRRLE